MSKITRRTVPGLVALTIGSCLARPDTAAGGRTAEDTVTRDRPAGDRVALDWPRWLGPDYDGVSKETGWLKQWPEDGPPRLWSREIGLGYSGIIVVKGRVVLFHRIDDENHLDCLDAKTGERRWRYSYETDYTDRYGYSAGPRCCPEVHEDVVYTLDPDGDLHAIDFETGKRRWNVDLRKRHGIPQNFFGTGATPLIDKGVIYFHLGGVGFVPGRRVRDGFAFALDAGTGKTIWKTRTDGGSYSAPTIARIDGARHLFVFHRGGMSDLDPRTGKQRWKYDWHSRVHESVNAMTPLVVDDILFFSATYRTGSVCLRIKKDSYEELWKDDLTKRGRILDIHWSPVSYLDGHIYAFSGRNEPDAVFKCVELATGKVKWEWSSYLLRGSMIYSDGHFIALGEWGDLALLKLDPTGHTELARLRRVLRRPAWTVPTLSGGLLYLRDEHTILCMDLRGKKAPADVEKRR